jgi:hypothetical protein
MVIFFSWVILRVIFVCIFSRSNCQTCLDDVLIGIHMHINSEHSGIPPHFSHEMKMYLNHCFPGQWLCRAGPQC